MMTDAQEGAGAGQASRPQAQANQQQEASTTQPADGGDADNGKDSSQQKASQEANPFRYRTQSHAMQICNGPHQADQRGNPHLSCLAAPKAVGVASQPVC